MYNCCILQGRPPLTDISKRGDGKTASTVQPSDEYGSETTSVCPFKERGEINCVKSQPMEPNYVNDFESENAKPPRPRRMSLPNIEINTGIYIGIRTYNQHTNVSTFVYVCQ